MGNADSTHTEKVDEVLKARRDLTISTKGDIDSFDFRVQTVMIPNVIQRFLRNLMIKTKK